MLIHRFKQLFQNQSGISLIEFLIGIAIMLIIIAPISNSLAAAINVYQYNMAQNQNLASAGLSVNLIADELRYATAFSISADEDTIDYTVQSQNRRIYIGSGNDAKTLIIEHEGVIIKKVAAKTVQAIKFQQDADNFKKINITIQLNDHSYAKSPNLNLTNISVIVQNI